MLILDRIPISKHVESYDHEELNNEAHIADYTIFHLLQFPLFVWGTTVYICMSALPFGWVFLQYVYSKNVRNCVFL